MSERENIFAPDPEIERILPEKGNKQKPVTNENSGVNSAAAFAPPDDIARIIQARKDGIPRRDVFLAEKTAELTAIAAERLREPAQDSTEKRPLIHISNLSFSYNKSGWRSSKLALDDVSLTLEGPGVIMLAGLSGIAGKSTLLRIIAGAQPYNSSQIDGSITFPGIKNTDLNNVNTLTAYRFKQRKIREAASLEFVASDEWGDSDVQCEATLKRVLSSSFSRIMLFDEPFRLMDPRLARRYGDRIKNLARMTERTFIVVAHNWDFIEAADHVVLLENGKAIINDSATAVLARSDLPNYLRRTLDGPKS